MGMVMGRTQARRLRFFKRLARVACFHGNNPIGCLFRPQLLNHNKNGQLPNAPLQAWSSA